MGNPQIGAGLLLAASFLCACDAKPAGKYSPVAQKNAGTAYVISSGCKATRDRKFVGGFARVTAVNGKAVTPQSLGAFEIGAGRTTLSISATDPNGADHVSEIKFVSLKDQVYQPYMWQQGNALLAWVKNSQSDGIVAGRALVSGSFIYYPCWLVEAKKTSASEPDSDHIPVPPSHLAKTASSQEWLTVPQ